MHLNWEWAVTKMVAPQGFCSS